MENRTIQSSEIDNDDVAARLAQLQSPADDAGLVAAGVALCCAVEQVGGDRMDIEIGCAGSGAELSGGWRVTVMRADDAVAAEEICQKYRKFLLGVCGIGDVRAEVPALLDSCRELLDGGLLDDDDASDVAKAVPLFEFLLETEPEPPGGLPGAADEADGVGERVLTDFMKSVHD